MKLLDFWASWCAPCRVLIPQLRDLYQELHPQGFEILGISFDDRRDVWARAIEEERMSWPQGSDLKGFQPGLPLTELYAISGILYSQVTILYLIFHYKKLFGIKTENDLKSNITRITPELIKEIKQMDEYSNQAELLATNNINTEE